MRGRIHPSVWLPLLLTLLAGCGDGGPGPVAPGQDDPPGPPIPTDQWVTLDGSPQAESRHDDLFFPTPELGWLVGTAGRIFRTSDRGRSWELAHEDRDMLWRAVGFVSPEVGWVGNLNRTNEPTPGVALFGTTDGGDTWTNVTDRIEGPEPVGICGIYVVDVSVVYAAGRWSGPAVFLRTEDGGASWTSSDLSPAMTGAIDVHFFDRDRGIVVGGRGVGPSLEEQESSRTVILGTEDGGRTWDERYVSETEGTWAWKISFPSREVGYVSVQGPAPAGTVLKTEDGGRSWHPLHVADDVGFSGIGFATPERGWVTGTRDYETTDGGATWTEVTLGNAVNRFRFNEDGEGYAAGARVYTYRPAPP